MVKFTVGIVTVSDTCFGGTAIDKSGPKLRDLVAQHFADISLIEHVTVNDDLKKIETTLIYFADVLQLNLILTTGGTGFSQRDVTPEATRKVIQREAPQLSLAMSLVSFEKTKFAALSRAICGIRNASLIINLPGSQKAVEECFLAISDVIPHAIELIIGESINIKAVHKAVQQKLSSNSSSVSSSNVRPKHICPHKTGSGSADDRNSPFQMIEVDDALNIILNQMRIIQSMENIRSPVNIPEFRASIKDGYALKSCGGKGVKRVKAYVAAGDIILHENFESNECFKINTGAPVPDFADAIVQVEDTKLIKSVNGVEHEVEILVDPTLDLDIRQIGCDMAKGEFLFKNDTFPGNVPYKSLLASVGIKCEETSHDQTSISIVSTGDELTEPGNALEYGKIYDSNSTMLQTLLEQYGYNNLTSTTASDSFNALRAAIVSNLKSKFIICSGGVSMGDKDFLKDVLKDLKFTLHFGRVNVKPGKPMTFATNSEGNFIFGLPGNPVSAFVTFHLFVLPAVRNFCGYNVHKLSLPTISVELLNETLELDPRPEYVRAKVASKDGKLYAEVTDNQISSRLVSIEDADVLLHLPPRTTERKCVVAGNLLKASILKQHFISSYVA